MLASCPQSRQLHNSLCELWGTVINVTSGPRSNDGTFRETNFIVPDPELLFRSVQFSRSVVLASLRPHRLSMDSVSACQASLSITKSWSLLKLTPPSTIKLQSQYTAAAAAAAKSLPSCPTHQNVRNVFQVLFPLLPSCGIDRQLHSSRVAATAATVKGILLLLLSH